MLSVAPRLDGRKLDIVHSLISGNTVTVEPRDWQMYVIGRQGCQNKPATSAFHRLF